MNEIKVKRSLRRSIITMFVISIIAAQLIVGVGVSLRVNDAFIEKQVEGVDYLGAQVGTSVENYLRGFETLIKCYSTHYLHLNPTISRKIKEVSRQIILLHYASDYFIR